MNHPIQLLVGLGNPGAQYAGTRHNAGEIFVQHLADQAGVELREQPRFNARTASIHWRGHKLELLVPTTFMNRSGQAVGAWARFYRVAPENILVAYDELDLPPGTSRFKFDGGAGGHNGIRDIISALGNQKNFYRLRIGIGHPGHASQVTGHVLSRPSADDELAMRESMKRAEDALEFALAGNWEKAMHQLHTNPGN